jgi:hypothetical protein
LGDICGFIQVNYKHQYGKKLYIKHEILRHKLTRSRYPLWKGWYSTINAKPQLLLDKGYDKVIFVQRDLMAWLKASGKYHRQLFTIEDHIRLSLKEPLFFKKLKYWHDLLNDPVEDHRYLKISLEDWNNFTYKTYHKLLDFLGFPKKNRAHIIPVHMENRDFDAYSDSHIDKDYKSEDQVEAIRNYAKSTS